MEVFGSTVRLRVHGWQKKQENRAWRSASESSGRAAWSKKSEAERSHAKSGARSPKRRNFLPMHVTTKEQRCMHVHRPLESARKLVQTIFGVWQQF